MARECYAAGLRVKQRSHAKLDDRSVVAAADLDPRLNTEDRMEPMGETQPFRLGDEPDKLTSIGKNLNKDHVKDIGQAVDEEVQKLLDAGFIREVKYTTWLANVVLVKNSTGKWRMCTDFTDLNKACPKDTYPLPSIDGLVDGVSGYEVLSFLDAYSSRSLEDHVKDLEEVLGQVRKYGMRLNPAKCTFGVNAGRFLGFMLTVRGIEANPDKCKAILEMRSPHNLKEIQRLVDRLTSLSRFIPELAEKIKPILKLMKKSALEGWNEECEETFKDVKGILTVPPVMGRPDPDHTLQVFLVVTDTAISAALIQEDPQFKLIYFLSRSLKETEVRYQKLEKIALSLSYVARRLRPYFQGHQVIVRTDYPIAKILRKPDLAGRMIGWSVELSEFGLQYEPRGSLKGQHLADFAVELPYAVDGHGWKLYVDGSACKTDGGAGIVLEGPNGIIIEQSIIFKFKASNNQAEYEALIAGMELARDIGAYSLECRTDSQNTRANRLSKLANGKEKGFLNSVIRQVLPEPSIRCFSICASNNPNSQNCWKDEIVRLIREQDERKNLHAEEAKKISRYCLIGDDLYRRGYVTPIMKCLSKEEADYVLRELHYGVCGRHTGGRALKARVLRAGFFWPTLEKDCLVFSQKCLSCQKHGNVFHAPATELHNIVSPWPFSQWGMDRVGPFPISRSQKKFLLVVVDYFTKWVEVEPLAKISTTQVKRFVWRLICRFGLPRTMITDNGRQFIDKRLQNFYKELGINSITSSVEHPQTNGQAEAANKIIVNELKKRLGEAKGGWVDEID
ncbi:uncharacterized protein LOC106759872 [Vigna radiata var. radiata]|uniref:Uncharacterized protein LOC106759872 n=1 Tax=Vigna radiata var. radiata TaxID=3916 RepID=A0A1S3TY88_VIGRR|nr:uncharacterized protein LOC106759872 [Vigna radiata var. radiata]